MQQDMKNEFQQLPIGNEELMPQMRIRISGLSTKQEDSSPVHRTAQRKPGQKPKLRPYGLVITFCFLVVAAVTIYSGEHLAGGILAIIPIFTLAKYYQQKTALTNNNDFNIN